MLDNQITRRGLLTAGLGCLAIVTSKNRVEAAACMLSSEQTEGPYYVDQRLIRRDITENRPGIPLRLQIVVLDGLRCKPIQNAAISIWHCDASGIYSGFTSNSPNGQPFAGQHGPPPRRDFANGRPPGPPPGFHRGPTDKTRFFRGVQMTDNDGMAEFLTIYPGWYMGRDIHIHAKVHTQGTMTAGNYMGGHVCHTGQLFFPEDVSDAISKLPPYASHHIERTRQADDDVFTSQHGSDFVLSLTQTDKRKVSDGFITRAVFGVNPNAEPGPVGFGGPPPRA